MDTQDEQDKQGKGLKYEEITNYLKATGMEVGLLINFGNPKLEYKRFTRKK